MFYSFFNLGPRWGGWSRSNAGRPDSVLIVQKAGWPPGQVWTSAENLATHRDSISESPAHKESLYRLRYPDLCSI
jgi:hypothetical protein